MKTSMRLKILISLAVLGTIALGCAQSKMSGTKAGGQGQAIMENPVEMVNQLGSEISQARTDQINVLSPDHFKRAESAYISARKDLEDGEEIADINESVIESRAYLKKAQEVAKVSRTFLSDAIEARTMARNAGAIKYEREYKLVENNFMGLTRSVERDNLSYAKRNKKKVIERYQVLEVRAIKENTIGEVRKLIAKAKSAGARSLAPKSYGDAVKQLNATDAFISANPYAKEEMHAMAKEALFKAKRLGVITAQISRVRKMKPEDIVLLIEKHLHTITSGLGAQDMRDQDYPTQLDNIIGTADALKRDRAFMNEKGQAMQAEMDSVIADYQAKIDTLNMKVATLEGKTREDQMAKERMARERLAAEQRLAMERKFNERYVAVRKYFKSNEAEVYKQENQLVIRLKAVRFPVGKSVIMPDNYNLLSKVQKAIRTFDDPRVIVEGHTDSTGSNEVNMLLSQQRAEAVREYMIANQTLKPNAISAVGYGSERPLASNASKSGRAINRRIDILIIPPAKPI